MVNMVVHHLTSEWIAFTRCDQQGRVAGGVGAVVGWFPIKVCTALPLRCRPLPASCTIAACSSAGSCCEPASARETSHSQLPVWASNSEMLEFAVLCRRTDLVQLRPRLACSTQGALCKARIIATCTFSQCDATVLGVLHALA